jgi:hypothetical protein
MIVAAAFIAASVLPVGFNLFFLGGSAPLCEGSKKNISHIYKHLVSQLAASGSKE